MKQIIFPENPVLLVDDETQLLFSAEMTLSSAGINHVRQCQDSREVLPLLTRQPVSAIVQRRLRSPESSWRGLGDDPAEITVVVVRTP